MARLLKGVGATQLRVVVVHQPMAVTRDEDLPDRLRGHAAALERWAAAGTDLTDLTDLIMGGHIHLPFVMPLARPGASAVGRAGGHGRLVSSRLRMGVPTSVNLLRWGAKL